MSFKSMVNVVSEQRQEIKHALASYSYFETWDSDLVAECCRVSSVVEFPPDEIISGSDTGNSHAVYFILEGVCKILQNLFIVEKKGPQQKLYKYTPSKILNYESKNEGYVSRLFKENHFQKRKSQPRIDEPGKNLHETLIFNTKVSDYKMEIVNDAKGGMNDENMSEIIEKENNSGVGLPDRLESERLKVEETEMSKQKEEIDRHIMILEECRKKREDMIRVSKKTTPLEKPKNTNCIFIQVGILLKGACFGLENSVKENCILTATTVKCLKIPRRFLLQHNPCNIWNRIRLFHSLHFPKEEKLFEYFKSDRMWMERKKMQIADIISLKKFPLYTSTNEVPYSVKLANPHD